MLLKEWEWLIDSNYWWLSCLYAVGITAIGAFVGGGGLGDIIIRGTNATNGGAIILAGSIPTAFMAVVSDLILGIIQRYLEPKGISTNQ